MRKWDKNGNDDKCCERMKFKGKDLKKRKA